MEKGEVYESLRSKIITNTLRPGEILNEKDLIARYGIGRTPLRDVLFKLQEEKLIKTIPRLGSMVTPMDMAEMRELVEVRRELEGFAAHLAAERIVPKQLKALRRILQGATEQFREEQEVDNVSNYFDTQFHHTLYEAACNGKLVDILQKMHVQMLRLWFSLGFKTIRFASQAESLYALLEAVERHDGAAARDAMQNHIDMYAARLKEKFL